MSRRKSQASKRSRFAGVLGSQQVRKRCSSCGSPALRWMDALHAVKVLGPANVAEARRQLDVSATSPVDFWCCERCREWGALSPAVAFGF